MPQEEQSPRGLTPLELERHHFGTTLTYLSDRRKPLHRLAISAALDNLSIHPREQAHNHLLTTIGTLLAFSAQSLHNPLDDPVEALLAHLALAVIAGSRLMDKGWYHFGLYYTYEQGIGEKCEEHRLLGVMDESKIDALQTELAVLRGKVEAAQKACEVRFAGRYVERLEKEAREARAREWMGY